MCVSVCVCECVCVSLPLWGGFSWFHLSLLLAVKGHVGSINPRDVTLQSATTTTNER